MRDSDAVVIEEDRTPAQIRLDLADGEVKAAPPIRSSLVSQELGTPEERAAYYLTPEFRKRLLDHLSQAKRNALAEIEGEAGRNGRS